MSTQNMFLENCRKLSLNYHQILSLSVSEYQSTFFLVYRNVPEFRTDRSVQTVQTQVRLRSGSTVCHSVCIFWTCYSIVKPHSSNFRIITANFRVSEHLGILRYMGIPWNKMKSWLGIVTLTYVSKIQWWGTFDLLGKLGSGYSTAYTSNFTPIPLWLFYRTEKAESQEQSCVMSLRSLLYDSKTISLNSWCTN